MSRQRVEVILLCEDKQHQRFVQEYLNSTNFKMRIVRTVSLSDGQGSGEQKVRENYRKQVAEYRRRSSYGRGGLVLIVVIDGDKMVKSRFEQLEQTLNTKRQPHEKIVHLEPKRNIETWIEYAAQGKADEILDYKHSNQSAKKCKEAAKQFAQEICPAGLPNDAPPALFTACEELNRIF